MSRSAGIHYASRMISHVVVVACCYRLQTLFPRSIYVYCDLQIYSIYNHDKRRVYRIMSMQISRLVDKLSTNPMSINKYTLYRYK